MTPEEVAGHLAAREHVHVQREARFELGGAEQRFHQHGGVHGAGLRLQHEADHVRAFVADVAQFTPKTVETKEERQKLTFRIKAHIPRDILKKYERDLKTGLPGVAYVQLDPGTEWPANLEVRLPEVVQP